MRMSRRRLCCSLRGGRPEHWSCCRLALRRPSGWPRKPARPDPRRSLGTGGWLVAALLGYGALATGAFRQFSFESIVIGWAWLTLASGAAWAFLSRRRLLAGWSSRAGPAGAVLVIVIAPLWRFNYNPQRSAKILFNSNVAYAYRSGLKPSLLMSLDEGRHVATRGGDRGVFTVWKYGGHQLQIRENGFPRGVISTDAEAFPRYTPETLQMVLPCVLFGKVERVLLLGLGSSEVAVDGASRFRFPRSSVSKPMRDWSSVARDVVSAETGSNPLDDERVTLAVCDPALGLGRRRREHSTSSCRPPKIWGWHRPSLI